MGRLRLNFLVFVLLGLAVWLRVNPAAVHISEVADSGEKLIFSVKEPLISQSLPAYPVAVGILRNHTPEKLRGPLVLLAVFSCVLLVYCLGARLHSAAAGLAAALAAVWLMPKIAAGECADFEQLIYSSSVLMCAISLAAYARAPAVLSAAAAGVSVGISLYVRAPLFLLAPFFILFRRKKARPVFLVLPWALLLPWLATNWSLNHKLILLEDRRADSNLITGALGLTYTAEGDVYKLAGIEPAENVFVWAAQETVSHPLRSAAAFGRRLKAVAGWHPVIFLLALLGFWRLRRNPEARAVAFLAAYFLGVHSLMAIEPRYFTPFWFILLPLAASCAWKPAQPEKSVFPFAAIAFLPCLALWVYVLLLSSVYPFKMKREISYAELSRKHPNNAWLSEQSAKEFSAAGNADSAWQSISAAYQNDSDGQLANYLAASVGHGTYADIKINGIGAKEFLGKNYIFRSQPALAVIFLDEGNYELAAQALERDAAIWRDGHCMLRNASAAYELKLQSRLREGYAPPVGEGLSFVLSFAAPERKSALIKKLKKLGVNLQ